MTRIVIWVMVLIAGSVIGYFTLERRNVARHNLLDFHCGRCLDGCLIDAGVGSGSDSICTKTE